MRSESFTHLPVEPGKRRAIRGGLMPAAIGALGVTGVLVWTMAAHDPYWRLFETPDLPAPAYESPEEIQAALAMVTVATPSIDSAAVRPDTATSRAPDAAESPQALVPRPAEPLVAVPIALNADHSPETVPGSPERDSEPRGAAPALVSAPPALGVPIVLAWAEPGLPGTSAPGPVNVPATPAPLWVAADEASEEALALARAERADVQRRLALAGFDPRGFDGVFGPRTRQAIADFQAAWGFPSTGYLDSTAYADLHARTEEAYAALASRAAAEPRAAPKIAPVARERQLAAADDTSGCARDANGRIIERQSFTCDIKGMAEKVVSLGRNKLPHEEGAADDGAAAVASGTSFARAGAER